MASRHSLHLLVCAFALAATSAAAQYTMDLSQQPSSSEAGQMPAPGWTQEFLPAVDDPAGETASQFSRAAEEPQHVQEFEPVPAVPGSVGDAASLAAAGAPEELPLLGTGAPSAEGASAAVAPPLILTSGFPGGTQSAAPGSTLPTLPTLPASAPTATAAAAAADPALPTVGPGPPASASPLQELRVVMILEGACQHRSPSEAEGLRCLEALYRPCTALSDFSCFAAAARGAGECRRVFASKPGSVRDEAGGGAGGYYKEWWVTVLAQAAPHLRALGWPNLRTVPDLDWHAVAAADVVVARFEKETTRRLLHRLRPTQRLVLLDKADASTIPGYQHIFGDPKVMLVLKQIVLHPPELQRGPLLGSMSHTALLAPSLGLADKLEYREWSNATLSKVHALLPMTVISRFPWACGSGLSKARFAGFFHPSLAHTWAVPRLSARSIDVALLGKGQYKGLAGQALTAHRAQGREAVLRFRQEHGGRYSVLVPETRMKDYPQYIRTLLDTKILVSPWGWGEWSLKDFEAVMAGCLLVKPMAGRFRVYPDIYTPGVRALSTDASFGNLTEVLLSALGDPEGMQSMADAAREAFLRHSDPAVIAGDLHQLLLAAVEREVAGGGNSREGPGSRGAEGGGGVPSSGTDVLSSSIDSSTSSSSGGSSGTDGGSSGDSSGSSSGGSSSGSSSAASAGSEQGWPVGGMMGESRLDID